MRRARSSAEGESAAHSELDELKKEIEALVRLDLELLRRRWRSVMGRPAPARLARGLLLRIIAYQHQITRLGDLDSATRIALGQGSSGSDSAADEQHKATAAKASVLRPGTVLEREYGGVFHRVTVTNDSCAWNGQNFRSLSEAARAITGTKWNGPRFFGLRVKAKSELGAAGSRNASAPAAEIRAEATR